MQPRFVDPLRHRYDVLDMCKDIAQDWLAKHGRLGAAKLAEEQAARPNLTATQRANWRMIRKLILQAHEAQS